MKKILIAFVLVTFFSCSKEEEQKTARLRPVKHMTVKKSGIAEQHSFSGIARANEEANLSFKVAGTVNRLYISTGDLVRNGQLIATLEPTDYQVNLQQALAQEQGSKASQQSSETQVKSAQSNFIAAQSSYQRITKLYENNSVSLSEFEQSKANFEAAKAQYDASKAQFEAAKFNTTASIGQKKAAENQVSYTRLIAPFSGVISSKMVEENELVNSGTPVVMLSTIGEPEVEVGIPEILISKIKKGMPAQVTFSTIPDQVFQANVVEVGYSPTSGATYPIKVNLENADEAIRPGMPANVAFSFDLPVGESDRIVVPAAAVGEDPQGRFVYKLETTIDNKATVKRQEVQIGPLLNQGFVIASGLQAGDIIASAGLNVLQDGDQVSL